MPFALDRDRIRTSAAFARLAGVAQINEPYARPPHHRQAHSRAVAQLGRRLARRLGADSDLVEAACLAHDLGHPPFGHDGERALATIATDCGGFEANAQTLRILTRLAPITPMMTSPVGLQLARATLDATCKYPWTPKAATRKFGAYVDDLPALTWLRDGAPARRLCLEAQIMDWADDVANAVHDLAHGVRTHHIPLAALIDRSDRDALARLATSEITTQQLDQVLAAADDLAALPALVCVADVGQASPAQADAAVATLTTQLLQRYINPIADATLAQHDAATLTRYGADLVVPDWARAEVAILTVLTLHYLLRTPANRQRRARHIELITELTWNVSRGAPNTLDPTLRAAWQAAGDDNGRLRVIVDEVAALTDAQAVRAAPASSRIESRSFGTA